MSATRVRRPSRYSGIAQPTGSADPDANAGRWRAARSYCSIEIRDRDPSVYRYHSLRYPNLGFSLLSLFSLVLHQVPDE